jgi:hypothetical protein
VLFEAASEKKTFLAGPSRGRKMTRGTALLKITLDASSRQNG